MYWKKIYNRFTFNLHLTKRNKKKTQHKFKWARILVYKLINIEITIRYHWKLLFFNVNYIQYVNIYIIYDLLFAKEMRHVFRLIFIHIIFKYFFHWHICSQSSEKNCFIFIDKFLIHNNNNITVTIKFIKYI